MARKIDSESAAELNELLHTMMVAIGRASGIAPVRLFNKYDLTLPQIVVLGTLERSPQTVSSLADVLQLTPGAVSRLVERMVRRGLVRRREGDDDRRRKTLTLTSAGRRVRDQLDTVRIGGFTTALAALDAALAAELKDVLTRVVGTLRSNTATSGR